jgi:hypothetical protein
MEFHRWGSMARDQDRILRHAGLVVDAQTVAPESPKNLSVDQDPVLDPLERSSATEVHDALRRPVVLQGPAGRARQGREAAVALGRTSGWSRSRGTLLRPLRAKLPGSTQEAQTAATTPPPTVPTAHSRPTGKHRCSPAGGARETSRRRHVAATALFTRKVAA